MKIIDGIFDYYYTTVVWSFLKNSVYGIGAADTTEIDKQNCLYIYSRYSDEDVAKIGILDKLKESSASDLIHNRTVEKCLVHLVVPGQTCFSHCHENSDVILYYANMEWRREWGGETIFYTKDNNSIEQAVEYVPNRLVYFNGDQPHAIRPPSFSASFYRFTLSIFLSK